MTDNIFDGLRGYIEYPCGCKAKILVYNDAHGTTSIQCPICVVIGSAPGGLAAVAGSASAPSLR